MKNAPKIYPPGTRFAVRNVTTEDQGAPCDEREEAMATLWIARGDAKREGTGWTYRLVVIPPKRPKRSVEERVAEAVKAARAEEQAIAHSTMQSSIEYNPVFHERIAAAIADMKARADRAEADVARLQHRLDAGGLAQEAVDKAVRERTEMILQRYIAYAGHTAAFCQVLRDMIRDGKVGT